MYKKTKRTSIIAFLLIAILTMSTVSSLAAAREANIKDGQTIKWHHDEDAGGVDAFTVDGTDLIGFCAEIGVPSDASGSAKVDMMDNNSVTAKTMYYIYQQGWDSYEWIFGSKQYKSCPGFTDTNGWYCRMICQAMTQYASGCDQGKGDEVYDWWVSEDGPYLDHSIWNKRNCKPIKDLVDQIARGSAVPAGYKIFIAKQSGQNYAVFFIPKTCKVKLKKTADRPRQNYEPSLAGAVYYVYIDENCNTRAKDSDGKNFSLTTDANGNTNTVEMDIPDSGKYYAKEITPAPGYKLDPTVRSVTVSSGETATFQSSELLDTGWAKLKKSSSNPGLTG